jgi:hypothetical protein
VSEEVASLFNGGKVHFSYWRWVMPLSGMITDIKATKVVQNWSSTIYQASLETFKADIRRLFNCLADESEGAPLIEAAIFNPQWDIAYEAVKAFKKCSDPKAATESVKQKVLLPDDLKHDIMLLVEQGKNEKVITQFLQTCRHVMYQK